MIEKVENLTSKTVLTASETCRYAGISKSFLYKLTSQRAIRFSKPFGKLMFFRKSDVDEFLVQNTFEAITSLNVSLPALKGGNKK